MPASKPSIPARLFAQAATIGDKPAWWVHDRGGWQASSWSTAADRVRTLARALLAHGVDEGQRVCILGFNCPAWVEADLAAMAIGACPAGIYETCSAEEVAFICNHAEAAVVFVEDQHQLDKLLSRRDQLPHLRHVVMFRGADAPSGDPLVSSWEEFCAAAEQTAPDAVDRRVAGLRPDQAATFIYTSGTTGPPKAVMLSHDNLAWTSAQAVQIAGLGPADTTVSYLPLCHIAELVFTVLAPITAGGQVYFARGRDLVREDLADVQPTVFLGVPRVWEKMHAAVSGRLATATGIKAALATWAMGVARRHHAAVNAGRAPGPVAGLRYKLARRLVLDKVRTALGLGNARFCVTGAAPISTEVLEFLTGLDLTVHEVYGQSEGSGPSSFNQPGRVRFGTVGTAFPGVELRIADDGEVLVRGRNVFSGYFKDPAATAAALEDGWLHSGDLGSIDDDGYLRITGRKKDIIITAGGKNIAPANIEAALKDLPLVSQAVVIGDRRRFLSALLTIDPEAAARELGDVELSRPMDAPALLDALQRGVDAVNARFARVEHVRKFTVLPGDLSVEGGELTPTLKVKRAVVADKYGPQIEAMYA